MRSHFFILLMMLTGIGASAQVGINNPAPHASAVLDLTSTTKGFLPPRLTGIQRDAITLPATGLIIYQTDGTAGLYQYNGTVWVGIGTIEVPSGTQAGQMQYWNGSEWVTVEAGNEGQVLTYVGGVLKQKTGHF